MAKNTVAVAMSGGVDSTAAAVLLLRAGYAVTGVTLRLDQDGDALSAAQAAAETLNIPHQILDCRALFRSAVMDRFVSEYVRGRTPNPCIDCNRTVKFGALFDWALEHGFDYLSTGHYARVAWDGRRWLLLRGRDRRKDQSYMLYQLTQKQLSRLLLPVGDYEKPAIRELAASQGLENAGRPDSQDICFIPDGDYAAFLERHCTLTAGDFVDQSGRVLGRHKGLECYTTGQRKGLGVSANERLYVIRKDLERNQVVLGPESALYSRTLTAEQVNWVASPPRDAIRVTAKTRYSQTESPARVEPLPGERAQVTFDEPQRAVTAGQAVVFYDGDSVAGGGTIRLVEA